VGATLALAAGKAKEAVVCAAALAENAIGPGAYRPDDILTMHSGHTVEINNTDAEGRLVLGDAVSYLARNYDLDAVIDAATLTGAQAIATGLRHAAVVSNREGLEKLAVRVGRETGDLTFPLPFAPEFFQDEFASKVADMKNSVANRRNAQSSCAA
jgi:probable aminopeptidase NPEPL1